MFSSFLQEHSMQKRLYQFMLLLAMTALVMAAASTAHADEGAPPQPAVGEEQPAEEPVPSEAVEEILEQVPEGTEVVVLSEEGVEPLASEAAAEIIVNGDPMWCPDTATPGDAGCTGSFGDFASLIAALAADAASVTPIYTGNGIIWVEGTYNGNDNAQVEFDGSVLSTLQDLTVRGGWSGNNDTNTSGTSTVDVSMAFVNWTGNITLMDLDIAVNDLEDDAGFGLFIQNTGTVTLDNVSVNDTPLNPANQGDGAIIDSSGNVDISNSEFNNNSGNGLQVESGGTIALDTVSASDNTLTGAFLNSCMYTAGLCAGNGAVTITSSTINLFSTNGFNGLVIDSGGGISIDHVESTMNSLNGAVLTSSDDDGTGDVSVDQSEFTGNAGGTGLDILTDGSIDLTTVLAYDNRTGAILDTTNGTGDISVTDGNFGGVTGNTWSGLHAESGGAIDLANVDASYNGSNGAYLIAEGNITVSNSSFNENVNSNFPEDPGLFAKSHGGNISLNNVIANGNDFGAGAVLMTKENGTIGVSGTSQFDQNGTIGIQALAGNGNITLTNIVASFNGVKGAYVSTQGTGDIAIDNSSFVENGSYGIYAGTSSGDINLNNDTVTGNGVTAYGAVLTGVNVFVTGSAFNTNTEVGLKIVASETVELNNVTADGNGGNGVEVYSPYTDGQICPGEQVVNVIVNADGGTFTNNGGYGLMVKPGPEGDLVFINPSTFGGNALGDYLLDLGEPETGNCDEDKEPSEPKDPNIVQVPSTGGTPVEQNCDLFSSTILELPNGTWMNVGCPFEGFSNLEELLEEGLPGSLGAGTNFAGAVTVSLTDEDGNSILNEDGTITINFKVPEDSRGRGYAVLFWDPTLNDGAGGWVEMPLFEFGTSFLLNPDNPDDPRTIISGVQQIGDTITLTVNFPGIFVLTSR
jgi:hypothetical protein